MFTKKIIKGLFWLQLVVILLTSIFQVAKSVDPLPPCTTDYNGHNERLVPWDGPFTRNYRTGDCPECEFTITYYTRAIDYDLDGDVDWFDIQIREITPNPPDVLCSDCLTEHPAAITEILQRCFEEVFQENSDLFEYLWNDGNPNGTIHCITQSHRVTIGSCFYIDENQVRTRCVGDYYCCSEWFSVCFRDDGIIVSMEYLFSSLYRMYGAPPHYPGEPYLCDQQACPGSFPMCGLIANVNLFATGQKVSANFNPIEKNSNFKSIETEVIPNPTSSKLTITFGAQEKENADFLISDLNGKSIIKSSVSLRVGKNSIDADLNNFPDGLYLFRIQTKDKVISKGFIHNIK
ncbi:MAG: hypothetical protein HW421_3430 [Ignavibacteria bacterium]|nr:hypothetical protein [Ignavibacteria bacterium]